MFESKRSAFDEWFKDLSNANRNILNRINPEKQKNPKTFPLISQSNGLLSNESF